MITKIIYIYILIGMSARQARANIAVSKNVADELSKVAEERGMTQFALASELLKLGLELVKNGYDSQQVRELLTFYKIMSELEIVPIPGRLLDKMITDMYRINSQVMEQLWCEAGKMLAGYIKALFGDLSGVVSLVPYLARILPAKRFEVKVTENNVVIDVVGIGYGIESVQVNAVAARCLLEEFGYKVEKVVTVPGVLKMEALK
jgi:hypothetical protein